MWVHSSILPPKGEIKVDPNYDKNGSLPPLWCVLENDLYDFSGGGG